MLVRDILKGKKIPVQMVRPNDTALDVAEKLRADRIGAVIVSSDGAAIEGIVSERDLAFGIATYASKLPTVAIEQLMSSTVVVCSPDDTINQVIKVMTTKHIRHLPVTSRGRLVGIISIRDVLEHRLKEVQMESDVLRDSLLARR